MDITAFAVVVGIVNSMPFTPVTSYTESLALICCSFAMILMKYYQTSKPCNSKEIRRSSSLFQGCLLYCSYLASDKTSSAMLGNLINFVLAIDLH